ncbi:DUF1836 domain-containing protein [Vallitalea okinawensis]|uniref:DUF1836 domain-containing protein n=1 Tax=Vallitalea okinawensis TaxID=2078660 RepID=UPI0013008A65|nr:DUF1836 domain-containing protein [Vallitalea okinawensis]
MKNKIEEFLNYKGIPKEDIPTIPLYMDQLLGFFDDYFSVLKIHDEDKLLTKTMVNNYVKAGVLNSPEKKKYDKEQMMLLNLIFQMKNILSINDLKAFLDFYKTNGIPKDIESVYDEFNKIEEKEFTYLKKEVERINDNEPTDKEILGYILDLVVEANIKKRLAEMLLAYVVENDKDKKKNDKK